MIADESPATAERKAAVYLPKCALKRYFWQDITSRITLLWHKSTARVAKSTLVNPTLSDQIADVVCAYDGWRVFDRQSTSGRCLK